MEILDFESKCNVENEDQLLARLRRVRRGNDSAFVLSHGGKESLWIHINGDAAFLSYFPDETGQHPGFVPNDMWPGEQRNVRFLLVGGHEADAIEVDWTQLVPVDVAYLAAVEFLHSPLRPQCVNWFEL